jgi:putative inorganic carbon (HCO3(-)) transporter
MSTPSASATTHPPRARLPGLDGRVAVIAAIVLVVAVLVVGPISPAALVVVAAAALVLAAVSAHRWPLPTLVAATLLTLADERFTPRVLPEGVNPGPIGLSEPVLLVVGIVLMTRAIRQRTLIPALRDPVIAIGALFVLVSAVSAIVNQVPAHVAVLGIVMTIDALAVYVIARTLRADQRGAGMAMAGVVLAIVAVAIFGIAQVVVAPNLFGFISFTGRFGEGVRITSIIGNPNMMATTLGIAIPFALYGSRHLTTPRWRWVARICLFILVLALLLTFSRGGWLAVGLGVVVGAFIVDWRSVPVLVLAAMLAWGTTLVLPRNLGLGVLDPDVAGGDVVGSTLDRLDNLGGGSDLRSQYLVDGIRIISANPVLGVGPGRYGGAAASIIPSPIYEEYDADLLGYRTVHNFWLHLTGEVGVIGAAVFLTLIAGLLIRLARAARRSSGVGLVVVGGAATVIVVASLHSVTEMVFEGNMPAFLIWLIMGLASTLAPTTRLFGNASPEDRLDPVVGGRDNFASPRSTGGAE